MPGLKVCSRVLIIVLAVAGAACANRPPTLNCLAEPSTVTEGDRVILQSNAVDPDKNARLTFDWSSEAGTLDPQNGSAVFDSTGLAPNNYTVSLVVRDEMPGPPVLGSVSGSIRPTASCRSLLKKRNSRQRLPVIPPLRASERVNRSL